MPPGHADTVFGVHGAVMMTTFCTIVACLGAFIGAALGTWAGDRLLERRLRERERREAEDRESRDWLREGDRQ